MMLMLFGLQMLMLGGMLEYAHKLRDRIRHLERRCDDNGIYSDGG